MLLLQIILPTKEASALADERNFHDNSPEIPLDSIQVHLTNAESKFVSILSDAGDILVEGKVKDDIPHLTPVGSFTVDVSLEGNLILCRQVDQPGMTGHTRRILGDENVNINFMSVCRTAPKKQAKMAIGVDEKPDKETLKIGEVPAIEEFVFLGL
nr:PREDICTED: D-3-phosphoglycerate dehydrogenase 1, chloroplastic-like [Musa acuminata subsp. malaccensis]